MFPITVRIIIVNWFLWKKKYNDDETNVRRQSVEPSSSSQISLDKTSLVTTEQADRRNDMVRVTYISGNVYEGHMSKWNPSGAGRLSLDDGAVVYEVTLR